MKLCSILVLFIVVWASSQKSLARDSKIDKARYKGAFWGVIANLELLRVECASINCGPRARLFALAAKTEYDTIDHRFAGHESLKELLNQLIESLQRSDNQRDIIALSFKFEYELLSKLDAVPLPAESLSRERGKNLYEEHCASCHGLSGNGDGPLSNKLKLGVESFLPPWRREVLTPLSTYAVMVHGSPKSEMTSFIDALSQDEMWNVAFYVSSLPYSESSAANSDCKDPKVDLYQLMKSTDNALEQELSKSQNCKIDMAYLRMVTTFDEHTPRERSGEVAAKGSKSARGLVLLSIAIALVSGGFTWVLSRRSRVE